MSKTKMYKKGIIVLVLSILLVLTFPFSIASAEPAAPLWEYQPDREGTVTLTRYIGESQSEILIPQTLDGMPVTGISGILFENCPDCGKVTILDNIEHITDGALGFTPDGTEIDGFVIVGNDGSPAKAYAEANGIAFKKLGFTEKIVIDLTVGLESIFGTGMGNVTNLIIIFLVSMLPIVELRGGLIAAALLQVNMWIAVPVCLLGNLIPVPFILLLITPIFNMLKKTKLFRPLVEKLEQKSIGKSETIQKYQFWGLVIFVGIPLPGTGAWTGSLIAALLDVKFRKAFPAICLGMLMATVIMCLITYGIPFVVSLFV